MKLSNDNEKGLENPKGSQKKVSIILLNYNGIKHTLRCLKSLQKIDYPNYEIIIVDNGSSDNSVDILRKIRNIKLIENKKNLGFAEGNNIGVRNAKGSYVALLNNDTFVERDWLKELVRVIESDKKTGIAMSKIYNKYEKNKYSFEGYGAFTLVGYFAWNKRIPKNTKKVTDVFFASGCSLLYKKSLVKEPFDKDYFIYAEDTYLSWLLRLKGYLAKEVPSSIVYHEGGVVVKGIKEMSNFFTELGERNRLMNILIFYEFRNILKLIPLILLTILLNNLYDPKRIFIRFKSYLWILFNFSKIAKKRRKIQSQRKISDEEIIKYMSCKLVEEGGINNILFKKMISFLNILTFLYCKLFNLKTIESQK